MSLFFPLFGKKSFLNRTLGLRKSFLNQTAYVLKNGLYQQSFLNRDSTVIVNISTEHNFCLKILQEQACHAQKLKFQKILPEVLQSGPGPLSCSDNSFSSFIASKSSLSSSGVSFSLHFLCTSGVKSIICMLTPCGQIHYT